MLKWKSRDLDSRRVDMEQGHSAMETDYGHTLSVSVFLTSLALCLVRSQGKAKNIYIQIKTPEFKFNNPLEKTNKKSH
jgi:hypothetical protein